MNGYFFFETAAKCTNIVDETHYLKQKVFQTTEELLQKFQHPDPIIPPRRAGGIEYDRNVPPRYEKGPANFKNTV